ncbi:MAG: SagB/ThcOx family dehydrogenase [Chitinispirillaceae bacterium]|nr:SagB/ThcOx family dehydrogenase [Chitinispirillaceae bacterium]
MTLEAALNARRSIRSYDGQALTKQEIGQLLFAAQGVTDKQRGFRAAPSAGATYPLETYCMTPEALFTYSPEGHELRKLKQGDHRKALARAALGQSCVEQAPCSIIFTAIMERTTGRYGQRGVMYAHMEAGHAAQNIHLQAVALGLGSVPVGAFEDSSVMEVLGCGKNEVPLYIIAVGRPKK